MQLGCEVVTQSISIESEKNSVCIGQVVLVPFGKRKTVGIIVGEGTRTIPQEKLKRIDEIYELDPIPQSSIELINFLANWYCAYKGLVLKMVLAPVEAITSPEYKKVYKSKFKDIEQIEAINTYKITSNRMIVLDFLLKSNIYGKGLIIVVMESLSIRLRTVDHYHAHSLLQYSVFLV